MNHFLNFILALKTYFQQRYWYSSEYKIVFQQRHFWSWDQWQMIILPNSLYSLLQIIDLFENPHLNHKWPKCLSFLRVGKINICHKRWGRGKGLSLLSWPLFCRPWILILLIVIEMHSVTHEYTDVEKNSSLICTVKGRRWLDFTLLFVCSVIIIIFYYGSWPLDKTPLPLVLPYAYKKLDSSF